MRAVKGPIVVRASEFYAGQIGRRLASNGTMSFTESEWIAVCDQPGGTWIGLAQVFQTNTECNMAIARFDNDVEHIMEQIQDD